MQAKFCFTVPNEVSLHIVQAHSYNLQCICLFDRKTAFLLLIAFHRKLQLLHLLFTILPFLLFWYFQIQSLQESRYFRLHQIKLNWWHSHINRKLQSSLQFSFQWFTWVVSPSIWMIVISVSSIFFSQAVSRPGVQLVSVRFALLMQGDVQDSPWLTCVSPASFHLLSVYLTYRLFLCLDPPPFCDTFFIHLFISHSHTVCSSLPGLSVRCKNKETNSAALHFYGQNKFSIKTHISVSDRAGGNHVW